LSLEFDLVPDSALRKADQGKIVILTNDTDDRVRAVVKLNRFVDAYLLVGRFVDSRVLEHIDLTQSAVRQYQRMERSSRDFQVTFVMIFAVVAVLLLLAAVWLGLTLANRLARPLSTLISAADRVGKGDLRVRVDASASTDEIGTLNRAFNRMTSQIETQQEGLLQANRELDERRRFTETVLAGVSAGVIGLDEKGRIHLPNRSASQLLDVDLNHHLGKTLSDAVPEMANVLNEVAQRPDRPYQEEVRINRGGKVKTMIVGAAAESLEGEVIGYVVTFDDVTDLVSAQRTAAWADVARRIAHEIKNPLTPIQLSAERLTRKYLSEITSDPETFKACTGTIVRQVEDIGRMVDEFSSFARMPQAVMKTENLSELCRQALFLEGNRTQNIAFERDLPERDLMTGCDSRQISRALTNLLKNAAESVNARAREEGTEFQGEIRLSLSAEPGEGGLIRLGITDNGLGLPAEHMDRLTEPYVTTRSDGTGLGLAIVRKIAEDHNGELTLENLDVGGARVSMVFPKVSGSQLGEEGGDAAQPPSAAAAGQG
jgi:two-component system nitrogen regulation sensor histidine kinase NtrY